MSDTNQLTRQWSLLKVLSSRPFGAAVKELSDDYEVSEKTIRRDLQTLRDAGFPLHERLEDHGKKCWKLDRSQGVRQLSFTFEEAVSLYLGRQFLEPLAGTLLWKGAHSAFRKIRSTLTEDSLRHLEKMAAAFYQTNVGVTDYRAKSVQVDELMVGIEERRVTLLTYHSLSATEPVTYELHPYGLVHHRHALYLVAYSPEHGEIRHFKINRVESVTLQDSQFQRPRDFDLQRHLADSFGIFRGSGRLVRVRVCFASAVARYVEEARWHASQQLSVQDDGRLIAEFELDSTEEIKKWLLSFGANAEVLAPDELRHEMRAEIERLLAIYATSGTIAQPGNGQAEPLNSR